MHRSTRLRRPSARIRSEAPENPGPSPKKSGKFVEPQLRSPVFRDRTNLTLQSPKPPIGKDPKMPRLTRSGPKSPQPPASKVTAKRATRQLSTKSAPKNAQKIPKSSENPPKNPKNPEVEPQKIRPSRLTRKSSKTSDSRTPEPPKPKLKRSGSLKTSAKIPKITRSKSASTPPEKAPENLPKPPKISEPENPKEPRKSKRLVKSDEKAEKSEKKFFKNKRILLAHSKISPMKRALKIPRRIPRRKASSPAKSHQPTLAESLITKVKENLRPRRSGRDYNEETIIQKKPEDQPTKAPVYKAANAEETSEKDKNEVYEFSFDANDSDECLPKKRKKKLVKKPPAKRPRKAVVQDKLGNEQPQIKKSRKIPGAPGGPKKALKKSQELPVLKRSDRKIPEGPAASRNPEKTSGAPQDPAKPLKKIPGAPPASRNPEKNSGAPQEAKKADKKIVKPPQVSGTPEKNSGAPRKPPKIPDDSEITSAPASPGPASPLSSRDSPVDFAEPIEVTVDVHVPSDAAEMMPRKMGVEIKKPKIVSTERLEGSNRVNLTSTPLNSNSKEKCDSASLLNRPSMQYKNMMNHSLMRRSFSPIVRQANEKFDDSSPWRPIIPETFSRVRNVFQSTPQVKKVMTPHGIRSLTLEKKPRIQRIVENELEGSSPGKSPQKSPRKFGTVLSNLGGSSSKDLGSSRSLSSGDKENSPQKASPRKLRILSPQPGTSGLQNLGKFEGLGKGGTGANLEGQQGKPLGNLENFENEKNSGNSGSFENGPNSGNSGNFEDGQNSGNSGKVQDLGKKFVQNRTLKQSNLNTFLNIPEMPGRTKITTTDGIFDDSGPDATVPGKRQEEFDVRNAFGFDEDSNGDFSMDSRAEVTQEAASPIGPAIGPVVRKSRRLPTRVVKPKVSEGLGRVEGGKRNLRKRGNLREVGKEGTIEERKRISDAGKVERNLGKDERKGLEIDRQGEDKENLSGSSLGDSGDEGVRQELKVRDPEEMKRDAVEAVHFMDTFDADDGEEGPVDVPLFVDLEPVHFREPARFSYGKRKRGVNFNTSEETEDDLHSEDEEELPRHKQKKRKHTKASKEQQKQLDAWAKSINETFEEIDHFSLVVE